MRSSRPSSASDVREARRRPHRADGVRTGRADADAEQVEHADRHRTSVPPAPDQRQQKPCRLIPGRAWVLRTPVSGVATRPRPGATRPGHHPDTPLNSGDTPMTKKRQHWPLAERRWAGIELSYASAAGFGPRQRRRSSGQLILDRSFTHLVGAALARARWQAESFVTLRETKSVLLLRSLLSSSLLTPRRRALLCSRRTALASLGRDAGLSRAPHFAAAPLKDARTAPARPPVRAST